MAARSGALALTALVVALWICLPTMTGGEEGLPLADRVVVYKARRKLYLYRGERMLKAYDVALGKNPVGHKQQEGDSRTPEGRYALDWRNARSKYHLSIHVSFPNEADRARAGKQGVSPGGDIMIHGYPNGIHSSWWSRYWFLGRDWTDGCIAVSNEAIEEIWKMVKDGTPIHIHP